MADEAPNWTPFRFCFNNPITITDPTGMSEVSDRIGGGADYKSSNKDEKWWQKILNWFGDSFQDKKYNVGKPEEQETTIKAPGYTEFDGEEAGELLRNASEKEQNSAQNFINDGSSATNNIASSAGSNTVTPKEAGAIAITGAAAKDIPVVSWVTNYFTGYTIGINIEAFANGVAKFLISLGVSETALYGYDSFAKTKPGKESARQKKVKHGGDGEGVKGRGAKGDKHTKPRAGRASTKNRQKPNFKRNK